MRRLERAIHHRPANADRSPGVLLPDAGLSIWWRKPHDIGMEPLKPKQLAGRTIAVPESRELTMFAEMLEQRGATTIRCPLVAIHDSPDTESVLAWLNRLASAKFDDLILLTGEGLRRLLNFSQQAGLYDRVVSALARVRKITRGPKPARALREIGLKPDLTADPPTTDGVIAVLARENLNNRSVGLQLYAQDPNTKLVQFLQQAGAVVHTVAPYTYAPASDSQRVLDLIDRLVRGEVDVIAFTSAPQVARLWSVAEQHSALDQLTAGLARSQIAAVGPIVAEELQRHGVAAQIVPQSSFSMGRLVHEIVKCLAH
jgi:uroporphyrinogen-III synthase